MSCSGEPAEFHALKEALLAAVHGPFFPDWEFATLFGLERWEVEAAALSFSPGCPAPANVERALGQSVNNLLDYPHRQDAVWAQWLSVTPSELRLAYSRWCSIKAERLPDDEVHVWQLPYQRALGRAPLCDLLGRYLGLPADRVALVEGQHGRPELGPAHDRPLAFNWSHSGTQALVAIARGVTPGIDLEQQRARPKALALARRFFTTDEAQALAALPEDARSDAFLRVWTAKEAVLKAHGGGISFGLHRLRVTAPSGQPTLQWMDGDDTDAWQLHALDAGPDYLAALAWRGGARRIRMR